MQQPVSLEGLAKILSAPRSSVLASQEKNRSSIAVCRNVYQMHPLHCGTNGSSALVLDCQVLSFSQIGLEGKRRTVNNRDKKDHSWDGGPSPLPHKVGLSCSNPGS